MEFEKEGIGSQSLENSLLKGLWIRYQTDNTTNELAILCSCFTPGKSEKCFKNSRFCRGMALMSYSSTNEIDTAISVSWKLNVNIKCNSTK
jgi:hypothetical protein